MSKRRTDEASPQKAKHVKPVVSGEERDRPFAENVRHCKVHITRPKSDQHEDGRSMDEHILEDLCAILNSGGGVLVFENADYKTATADNLDTYWRRLEEMLLTPLVHPSSYNSIYDRVGEHHEPKIYLFCLVPKTLCTARIDLYLPKDKSVKQATATELRELLEDSPENTDLSEPSNDLENVCKSQPSEFHYGQKMSFSEGNNIQFKCYSNGKKNKKSSTEKKSIKWAEIPKYISAFANADGGQIFLGVSDDGIVFGEEMDGVSSSRDVETTVERKVNEMFWMFTPERGIHWDVQIFPVQGAQNSVVITISVAGMKNSGGVFCSQPESFYLSGDELKQYGFKEWKQKLLPPGENFRKKIEELSKRLIALDLSGTPLLMVKGALKDLREDSFQVSDKFLVTPNGFESTVPAAAPAIKQIQDKYAVHRDRGLLVGYHSLLRSLNPDIPHVDGVVCDVLVVSREKGLHLVTVCHTDPKTPGQQFANYSLRAAKALKQTLVEKSGCREGFFVTNQVVPSSTTETLSLHNEDDRYPDVYKMASTRGKFSKILDALIIVLASFPSPLSSKLGVSFLNMLTAKQFKLVKQLRIMQHKECWVEGRAGTGKSLVAVEFMRELRRCQPNLRKDEILYVCENIGMRERIRREDVCHPVCRKAFMDPRDSFLEVRHVIMDEVQCFRTEDGDWLTKAREIVGRHFETAVNRDAHVNPSHVSEPCVQESGDRQGVLCFFTDKEQCNHRFETGLPPEEKRRPLFTLNKVIRNSKKIFDYSKRFLPSNNGDGPEIGHDFEGEKEAHLEYEPGEQIDALKRVVKDLINQGYDPGDIAILFEKEKKIPNLSSLPRQLNLPTFVGAEENHSENVVVSTIRKYGGLDRPVVILVDVVPLAGSTFGYDKRGSLYGASTRAMVKLICLDERRLTRK